MICSTTRPRAYDVLSMEGHAIASISALDPAIARVRAVDSAQQISAIIQKPVRLRCRTTCSSIIVDGEHLSLSP